MSSKETKRLEFNQYRKSDKAPFIIYADLTYLIENIDGFKNNPEKLSTTKIGEHFPLGFSVSRMSSFKRKQNKHDVYRGKNYMKKFCKYLGRHAIKINNLKIKKMKLLTKKQQ